MNNISLKLSAVLVFLSFCGFSYCHSTSESTFQTGLTKHFEDTIKTNKAQLVQDINAEDTIFSFVEEMPEFPGGNDAMMKFLMANLTIRNADECLNGIYGRFIVKFVVTKNGKIRDPKILRPGCPSIDMQLIKLVKSFPDWKPGLHFGKPVNVYFTIPLSINFKE